MFVVLITLASQVVPLPPVRPSVLYSYVAAKGLLFFLTGVLTPFSFWRFNRLAYGAMYAVLSIVVAEALQGLIAGHRTSYLELVAKLLVLFTGFAFALELRF